MADSSNKYNTLKNDKKGKAGYIVSSQKRQQQRSVADEIQPAFPRTKIHYLLFIAKEIIKIKDSGNHKSASFNSNQRVTA